MPDSLRSTARRLRGLLKRHDGMNRIGRSDVVALLAAVERGERLAEALAEIARQARKRAPTDRNEASRYRWAVRLLLRIESLAVEPALAAYEAKEGE